MSTDYDIHCLDCPPWGGDRLQSTGMDDFREGSFLHLLLTTKRDALADVGEFLANEGGWLFNDRGGELAMLCRFFAYHRAHRLEVRSEYGEPWAQILAERAAREAAK